MNRTIGVIANPASGKDIRRLVSYATTIDNNEKVNICKRIVLAAQGLGIERVLFMPETFMIGWAVREGLESDGVLRAQEDTTRAARMLEEQGVGCVVVLGGDGTSRAAAKGIAEVPMLSVSTGTNNVYPTLMEGTVAGMAAAAVSLMPEPYGCCLRDKRIEVRVNGQLRDIALIDAVVSDDFFAGARAIWDAERMRLIVASRCHPATIGFSAVAGVCGIVEDRDNWQARHGADSRGSAHGGGRNRRTPPGAGRGFPLPGPGAAHDSPRRGARVARGPRGRGHVHRIAKRTLAGHAQGGTKRGRETGHVPAG